MKTEQELLEDIAECNYCINGLCNTMRKMRVPQSQWANNVIVKGYLERIAKNKEQLKQLRGETK
jgi:hypothetical protein